MHIKIEKGKKKKSIKIIVILVKGELQKQILSLLTLYSLRVLQYIRKLSNISKIYQRNITKCLMLMQDCIHTRI